MRLAAGHRRLLAYLGIAAAMFAGFYMLGPVATRNRCLSANHARAELKDAFHIVITGFGDTDQIAQLDKQVQKKLAKGLPGFPCDNTVVWPFTTFVGTTNSRG